MMNLGKRLKDLRVEMELTQGQVAQRIGVTASVVSAYETGIRQPSLESLIKLACLFDVSTDYLLGVSDSTASKPKNMVSLDGLSSSRAAIVRQLIAELRN